jgi:hypothetical protein
MALTCPACSAEIRKKADEPLPMPGVVYRCSVCRLELVLDRDGYDMNLAPIARDMAADRPSRRRRDR